jgi:hypothetical protein
MKSKRLLSAATLLLSSLLSPAISASSLCSTNYCLVNDGFSSIAGDVEGASQELLATNMYPFPQRDTWIETYYQQAIEYLDDGKTYRESLLLLGGVPGDGSPIGSMLADPNLNYESAGLLEGPAAAVSGLAAAVSGLETARDTFAIALYRGHPDEATAKTNLLDTLKTLASIYLIIGDEYLTDALEWRFSSDTLGLDEKLDEQIGNRSPP